MNLLNLMNFCTIIALELTSKKKFAGIINPEEDTPSMRNQHQHQHHQGKIQSKTHHCIFMRIIPCKLHCICLFAYHYHMCVSFLDTLGSSLHESRYASRSLLCIQKLHHAFTEKPTNGNTVFLTQNSHKTFHKTHFV